MVHRNVSVGLTSALLLTAAMSARTVRSHGDDDGDESRIKRGFAIGPVELKFPEGKRAVVGLGSYIVNAQAVCNDCHTCPSYAHGGNPFAGQATKINAKNYLAGGVPFGPFVSHNITPDATGKPFGLSFPEFRQVMLKGHDPDEPDEILQVMPWPVYGNMTDHDLRAIYEYLRAIPPAQPGSCTGPGEAEP